jgi:uncharacterized tellurite resistance protein B-like protein
VRVFDAIKSLVSELAGGGKQGLEGDDYRLATAALLVHAATVDGGFNAAERDRLAEVLKQRFDLDDATANALIENATVADQEAIDLYRFTRQLNGSLDGSGRLRLIEMMWQVAYADGAISEYESNLIWRVADLLGVSANERIALRQRAAQAREGGSA